jgi:hypothetical protein
MALARPTKSTPPTTRQRTSRSRYRLDGTLFLDASSLPAQSTQVVQLGSADLTASKNLDAIDPWRMEKEGSFDTDAVRDAADRKGLGETTTSPAHYDAFEVLDTLFARLDNLDTDSHVVARIKVRNFFLYVWLFDRAK